MTVVSKVNVLARRTGWSIAREAFAPAITSAGSHEQARRRSCPQALRFMRELAPEPAARQETFEDAQLDGAP